MSNTQIVTGIQPSEHTPAQVAREFRKLLDDGRTLRVAGSLRKRPRTLLARGYTPKHKIQLFETTYYLTNVRRGDDLTFLVAYVMPTSRSDVHARLFYKDTSLVWRSPSHHISSKNDNWIGKGDLKVFVRDNDEIEYTAEETTNLPLEIQSALDTIAGRPGMRRLDLHALALVLRQAPEGRFEPYEDFRGPRRAAMSQPENRIHGGQRIAWFERANDPTSLVFAAGFEPDFDSGVLEIGHVESRFYGGRVRRFRIVSKNREIQYQIMAAPRHVWIIPPQALTTEIMSYGLRTVDVDADDDLFVPGYEFHFVDTSTPPPSLYSQIPEGFAGASHPEDPSRADASPWLEKLPVVKRFRSVVLSSRRS